MKGGANPIIWEEQKEATDEWLKKKRQEEDEGVVYSVITILQSKKNCSGGQAKGLH